MLYFILILSQFATAEEWFCKEESIQRQENVVYACGIGESINDEAHSRKKALQNAIDEFRMICDISDDCRDKKFHVEPKRTECGVTKVGLLKCYRMIQVTIK